MSWDVFICKFARPLTRLADAERVDMLILGARSDVHKAVDGVFPRTDWTDPAWGHWDGEHGSIEFSVGEDPCDSMMLHVRASPAVVGGILKLCNDHDWRAVDCSAGEFLAGGEDAVRACSDWLAYRNRVIGPG